MTVGEHIAQQGINRTHLLGLGPMTTLHDITRELWGTRYPGITWATQMDGNLLHIAGTHNGREEQRMIHMTALRIGEHHFVRAIDEACSEIADELTGETHLAWLERIGPLPEPLPRA